MPQLQPWPAQSRRQIEWVSGIVLCNRELEGQEVAWKSDCWRVIIKMLFLFIVSYIFFYFVVFQSIAMYIILPTPQWLCAFEPFSIAEAWGEQVSGLGRAITG